MAKVHSTRRVEAFNSPSPTGKKNNLGEYVHTETKRYTSGVVIKDVIDEVHKRIVRVLKQFKKLRAQKVEEPSTKVTSTSITFEANCDNEETGDAVFGNDDLTLHHSLRKDATVKSNSGDTSMLDVTINACDVDTNKASGESIITLLPEKIGVTPPEGPITKSNVEEG